ncbi:MAG TPA: MarR family winged helix-turn-helix transcriptional regulator [Bacillota bacterium]|nr:MarR family winged helix-turn-helix transcriptional regulator [Bacillota bacterium]HNT03402.1 MarR family winged helix-turn-helix transcriptional regulator [Bacillota bacterium]
MIKRHKSVCYCINLRRAANAVTDLYNRVLLPIGLTVSQYSLLINIGRLKACSVSDLAGYVGLERTTLVRSLKPLFKLKYIEDVSEKGRRSRLLKVTESGQQVLNQGEVLWRTAQAELEKKVGKEKLEQLSEILSQLVE